MSGDLPACAVCRGVDDVHDSVAHDRRERIATAALAAIVVANGRESIDCAWSARAALNVADALIAELDQ